MRAMRQIQTLMLIPPGPPRAYQILKAAENADSLMVGKGRIMKKIDFCTAYEIVQRDSFVTPGKPVYAYRIVEATIVDNVIQGASTAQAGDELTFDACVEFIEKYRKFANAPVKTKDSVDEKWNGVIELHFEADSKFDADELYDILWMLTQKIEKPHGGRTNEISLSLPEGVRFKNAKLPDDAIFLPEE